MKQNHKVAILGNPNCGKTAIFNLLTGLNQKVSNYPGITVEKKSSQVKLNTTTAFQLEDYPGSYSMISQSIDEDIVSKNIYQWIREPESRPNAILYVVDVNNIRRNLYFCTQLLELNIPTVVLLNMYDIVSRDNKIDNIKLKEELKVHSVIPFSASKKTGFKKLKSSLLDIFTNEIAPEHNTMPISEDISNMIKSIETAVKPIFNISGS